MKSNSFNSVHLLVILSLLAITTKYTTADLASNEDDNADANQNAPYNQLETNADQDVEEDQTKTDPEDDTKIKDSSEESKENNNDIPQPPQYFEYPDNLDYSSYSSGPYINTDEIFESSYEEGYPENYSPFKNKLKESRYFFDNDQAGRIKDILCSILDLCDFKEETDSNEEGQDYSSDNSIDNAITIDAQPLDNNVNINDINANNEAKTRSRRSIDDIKNRAKRDLSFAFDGEDDDTIPLDELEFLAELVNAAAENEASQQEDLGDVLDSIEGLRRDQLSAGEILAEFELDEENGGLPYETNNDEFDNLMRKRDASRRDMTKFIQSLPTLEGMKKRSNPNLDDDEIDLSAYPRDLVVAAENELAAQELQNIENKAQVAAAMLDNAANLISVIENMAVDIVAEYLGLDNDENEIPLDINEFQQYLPSVPAKSIEKRIGRERYNHYPSGIEHPYVSDDLQQPFKGSYEPIPRQRYPGVPSYGSYRRPSYGSRYRGVSRAPVPPPFVDKHIGIFPNENIFQPRYRRVQPSPYNANSSPIFSDDKYTDRNSENALSRIFSVNGNGVGRLKSDGRPYLDGYFDDDEEKNLRVDDGLQEAFDAALMMENKIKNNANMERGLEDAYVGNLLSNIFRGKIGNSRKF